MKQGDTPIESHFNGLTPAQAERLALLLEEMGEAQQMIGKILRHGYSSYHSDGGVSNRANLQREIGQVIAALDLLVAANDLSATALSRWREEKHASVKQWLHHQEGVSNDWRFPV